MRILYLAKHGSGGNDDEGAVAYALRALGHAVIPVPEKDGINLPRYRGPHVDFLLFHKWHDPRTLKRLPWPSVFWYFDLVRWPSDPTIQARCAARVRWMNEIVKYVEIGFCTDGDLVRADPTGKLVWLPQGADERVVGRGTRTGCRSKPLLFTGLVRNVGVGRKEWFDGVVGRYGPQLTHYSNGMYREELREAIAQHCITLAPNAPVTDFYWSNRIYNALGFGAFLLHPYCESLSHHYVHGSEVVYYTSPDDMFSKIEQYLPDVDGRHQIAEAGLQRTLKQHLYRHRCEELLRVVKERLGVGP